jgi:regulator of protease activity HflC (stomatin/prohibitin superfamily)
MLLIVLGIILLVIIVIAISNICIVPQAQAYIIERLGTYHTTWHTGLHMKLPFFDRIRSKISLMEKIADFDPQDVITKDNVKMRIDTVVFYQITDCKLYTYGVEKPRMAIENLTATTLRNIIGELELDNTLTSRDIINSRMRTTLDEATDPWGIKVNRVELKNIIPPKEIQDAMEKQMKAERERREKILIAEGTKAADILTAEGKKQAMILNAEAQKQEQILLAEAEKEARIRLAEGEAEAILQVQKATADGIRLINEANPSQAVIAIKSLEAFEKAADGKATKIIIPSEIQSLAGLATSVKELLSTDTPTE